MTQVKTEEAVVSSWYMYDAKDDRLWLGIDDDVKTNDVEFRLWLGRDNGENEPATQLGETMELSKDHLRSLRDRLNFLLGEGDT